MKALFLTLIALTAVSVAHADGFRCQTTEGDLNVKIYNNTDPSEGTRNSAIMILSQPEVQYGRKTIASFSAEKGTLSQEGTNYTGRVDLRVSESSVAGKYVGGTRLGELQNVLVETGFNYNAPVADGETVYGQIIFQKRDGSASQQSLACVRYLKGEQE